MKLKALMLGGAALIALSGVALAADPEERAVTRDLNSQQLDTPSIVTAPARPGEMSGRPVSVRNIELDEVDNPQAMLMHRMVETRSGEPLGRVTDVVFDQEGRTVGIDVALNNGRVVSIDSDSVVFDEDDNVLITDMPGSEVRNLPGI